MNKETSSRVSSIAARIMSREPTELTSVQPVTFNTLLADAKILAASCMSQDETPGQGETFIDRLHRERAQLSGRVDALTLFLSRGAPGITIEQHELLKVQIHAMSLYLQVLDARLRTLPRFEETPLVASDRNPKVSEMVEIGGHDEDRDGPIPFGD